MYNLSMKSKLLTICLLLVTSQVFASESYFKSDLFKGSNLVSHCHNMKASWEMPLKHHYPYEMNRVIWVEVKTTRETLEALVPKPLKINESNSILFYIGKFNIKEPNPSSYHESGILVPVTYKDSDSGEVKKSFFVSIMHLDKNIPIVGGRVIYGANKYFAEIDMFENENTINASVKIPGVTLIEMKVNLQKKLIDKTTEFKNDGWIAAKCMASNNIKSEKFKSLNLADVSNFKIHEFHTGDAELKLNSNKEYPFGNIPILEIKEAVFQIDSWLLGDSLLIHSYKQD